MSSMLAAAGGRTDGSQVLEMGAKRRWRGATLLTTAMMVVYFGFILLVAYDKPLLGTVLVPGLSLGMVLGTLVIVTAWVVTWYYVRWTNRHYDAHIEGLRR